MFDPTNYDIFKTNDSYKYSLREYVDLLEISGYLIQTGFGVIPQHSPIALRFLVNIDHPEDYIDIERRNCVITFEFHYDKNLEYGLIIPKDVDYLVDSFFNEDDPELGIVNQPFTVILHKDFHEPRFVCYKPELIKYINEEKIN